MLCCWMKVILYHPVIFSCKVLSKIFSEFLKENFSEHKLGAKSAFLVSKCCRVSNSHAYGVILTHLTCYSRTHAIDKFTHAFKKNHTLTHPI